MPIMKPIVSNINVFVSIKKERPSLNRTVKAQGNNEGHEEERCAPIRKSDNQAERISRSIKEKPLKGTRRTTKSLSAITLRTTKNCVRKDYLYTFNFSGQTKVRLPTSHYKLDLVFVLCSSDWTLHLHHREPAYLSPFVIGLFVNSRLISEKSLTGRIISPSKVD